MAYSPFFQTLHDETGPIGNLGRGSHYSVLRAVTWHDESQRPLNKAAFQDFAVIWDEDHDTRIVEVIERLYFAGLLAPVKFIAERKGVLIILVSIGFFDSPGLERYQTLVRDRREIWVQDDRWDVEVDGFPGNSSIIGDERERVSTYLACIEMLWNLGVKPTGERARPLDWLPSIEQPQPAAASASRIAKITSGVTATPVSASDDDGRKLDWQPITPDRTGR